MQRNSRRHPSEAKVITCTNIFIGIGNDPYVIDYKLDNEVLLRNVTRL
jgi:hypothetical protein